MRLATCDRCKSSPVMVNVATVSGCIVGEFCGDCWDDIPCDDWRDGGNRLRVPGRKPINRNGDVVEYPVNRVIKVEG